MEHIKKAIKQAVNEKGQSEQLAKTLIAWISELAKGNESITDMEVVERRLDLILQKTEISENNN